MGFAGRYRQHDPLALLAANLWLSDSLDTLDRQTAHLLELRQLAMELEVPVVVAGGFFLYGYLPYRVDASLINYALEHLPTCYGVAGEYDLPEGDFAERKRTSFWTLAAAGRVHCLMPRPCKVNDYLYLHGYHYGQELPSRRMVAGNDLETHLLVAACGEGVLAVASQYDAVLVGDTAVATLAINHRGGQHWYSPGPFVCRTNEQRKRHRPEVGILCKSGKVLRHLLRGSEDLPQLSLRKD